jgi:hypothetical protein
MTNQKQIYITLEWQEQGPLEITGRRLWLQERRIYAPPDTYPQLLPCHNPACENGGFDIGEKIAELLASEKNIEQNSLICRNAINQDRSKRCLHTITYSITCVRPYQREKPPGKLS